MIYLASPYTHSDPLVQERRYLACIQAMRFLLNEYPDQAMYSPIVHWHEVAKILSLPKDAKFWEIQDFGMILKATRLVVLRIDGWSTSKGVAAEIEFAEKNNIPVEYL